MLNSLFHSAAADAVFNEELRLQSMLDFEAALARAQAHMGIIPAHAAQAIAASCLASRFDFPALSREAATCGNLAIPMVKQLTVLVRAVSPESSGFVHRGATSQDVIDTGFVLQLREGLRLLEAAANQVCAQISMLTERHRRSLMPGRTWLQQAVPITFGLKTAGWLDAFLRMQKRLEEMKPRVLVLQFGGAAGTLAALGIHGYDLAAELARELNLHLPLLPWHGHRDRVAEAAAFHGLLCGTLGKIARDISLLMQTEIAEVSEPSPAGRGGSSTMPHKRNPVACAAILSSAIRVPGLVGTMLSAMLQEHERGLGGWHAEWEVMPEICLLTLGSLEKLGEILTGFEVYAETMQRNLAQTGGMVLTEAVSMALAEHMGKDPAHTLVESAARRCLPTGNSLRSSLEAEPEIMRHLTSAQLDTILDPAMYLGSTQIMIDAVLGAYRQYALERSRKRE